MRWGWMIIVAACDTGLGEAGPAPPPDASPACLEANAHDDFPWLRENVLRGCSLTAACHGARAAGGLDLRPGVAYEALVDRAAQGDPEQLRVAPFDPGGSYLLGVLSPTTPIDRRMPPQGALCPEQIAAIERWIAKGAPAE